MAAAVAAVAAEQTVTIGNSESVAKSYPSFFEELASIGGKVDEQLR
jgi:5-enolpyruvylshikimate-3-phosphate synthase